MACLSSRSNNANEDPREGVDDQLKLELLNYLRGEYEMMKGMTYYARADWKLMILPNFLTSKDAPPTNAPSISGMLINESTLSGIRAAMSVPTLSSPAARGNRILFGKETFIHNYYSLFYYPYS